MPWVQFQSRDGLRIALAAGAIPMSVAAKPILARLDGDRITLEADDIPNLDGLRRLGGRPVPAIQEPFISLPNCFVGVPLEADESPVADGPVLVAGPARDLSAWLMRVRRQVTIRRLAIHDDRAFIHCDRLPQTDLAIYRAATAGNWVRAGWAHRLAAILPTRSTDDLIFDCDGCTPVADWHEWGVMVDVDLPATRHDCDQSVVIDQPLRFGETVSPLIRIDDESAWADWLSRLGPRARERIRVAWLGQGDTRIGIAQSTHLRIPVGRPLANPASLRPTLRDDIRRRITHDRPDRVTWLDEDPASITIHQAPRSAFRPAEVTVSFAATDTLTDTRHDPFALDAITTVRPVVEPSPVRSDRAAEVIHPPSPKRPDGPTFLARFFEALRPRRAPKPDADPIDEPLPTIAERQPLDLERRITTDYGAMTARERGRAWADLAEVNTLRRAHSEASICWLNAVWENHAPPAVWLESWVRVEREPRRQAAIRAMLDQRPADGSHDDWPVRLIWLEALTHRDPLRLARTFDRLTGLLVNGLAADRDAPAFLRRVAGDDFAPVRDWVLRSREAARRWIAQLMRGRGRLQRVGLDADPQTTSAYADLLFAGVAGRLGEQVLAGAWRREAVETLAREPVEHRDVHDRLIARVVNESMPRQPIPDRLGAFAVRQFELIFGPAPAGTRFTDDTAAEPDGVVPRSAMDAVAILERIDTTESPVFDLLRPHGVPFLRVLHDTQQFDAAGRIARRLMTNPRLAADEQLAMAAAAWLAAGQTDRGLTLLDACRDQLFSPHRLAPRDQTALAVGSAQALGLAPPRIARGRLEELFQRADGLDLTGSVNRYYCRQPLMLIRAAIDAAVPGSFGTGPELARWLAEDERIVRQRIRRDMAIVESDGSRSAVP